MHPCASATRPARSLDHPARVLSAREMEVVTYAVRGFKNHEIAQHLGIHRKTVEAHRASAYKKWRVRNTAELVGAALRVGIR